MKRTMLMKIMGLSHLGGEEKAKQKDKEEMKEKKGKEEVKLLPLHLRIPLLG
jgi:hypothetical protein